VKRNPRTSGFLHLASRLGVGAFAAVVFLLVGVQFTRVIGENVATAQQLASVRSDIARVYIASAIAYSVNLLVFIALVNEFAVGPMAAKMAGTGVGFLLNFASRQFLIFAPSAWLSSRRSATDRQ